ncbi:MAG: hypothetical protein ACK559_21415, partial [bacterium]
MSYDDYDLGKDVIIITEPNQIQSNDIEENDESVIRVENEQEITKEAINNYYKLKFKYENKINDFKRKIIGNTYLTKKEKKSRFSKFIPKCVICKRNGGSVFSNKNRLLKA